MKIYKRVFCTVILMAAAGILGLRAQDADAKGKKEPHIYPTFGEVERLDPALDAVLPPNNRLQKLAEGFDWSEGPVWDKRTKSLYFSDVPRNIVFVWKEGLGTRPYIQPSGYTGTVSRDGEPGSNGLTLDSAGHLILCQHGDRQVARLVKQKRGHKFVPIAEYYEFRRFNSPNDLVYRLNGELYFTDPPYGLLKKNEDPAKELPFNGVFRVSKDGKVTLLTDDLTFPNGLAFSPDEKKLYVAQSDPQQPVIKVFDVLSNGNLGKGKVFFDATHLMGKDVKGLPDGMKVDKLGNLFATGPGGILIISPEGKHLGTIHTGEATANCAWGDDGGTLYITADMYLARIRTSTKGARF